MHKLFTLSVAAVAAASIHMLGGAIHAMPKQGNYDMVQAAKDERQAMLTRMKEIREDDRAARAYQVHCLPMILSVKAVRKAWAQDVARKNSPEMVLWWEAYHKQEEIIRTKGEQRAKRQASKLKAKARKEKMSMKGSITSEAMVEALLWEVYNMQPTTKVRKDNYSTKKNKKPTKVAIKKAIKTITTIQGHTPEVRGLKLQAKYLMQTIKQISTFGASTDLTQWLVGIFPASKWDMIVLQRAQQDYAKLVDQINTLKNQIVTKTIYIKSTDPKVSVGANQISTNYNITEALLNHDCTEFCDHVEADKSLAYSCFNEDDSFGPLVRYVSCKPCHDKDKAEYAEQTTCCLDCKQQVKNSEMRQWRWYDFYAPQGDEPLNICKSCWVEPKHQGRLYQDKLDRDAEDRRYSNYDY